MSNDQHTVEETRVFIAWVRVRFTGKHRTVGVYMSYELAKNAAIDALKDQLVEAGYPSEKVEKVGSNGAYTQEHDWGVVLSTLHY